MTLIEFVAKWYCIISIPLLVFIFFIGDFMVGVFLIFIAILLLSAGYDLKIIGTKKPHNSQFKENDQTCSDTLTEGEQ